MKYFFALKRHGVRNFFFFGRRYRKMTRQACTGVQTFARHQRAFRAAAWRRAHAASYHGRRRARTPLLARTQQIPSSSLAEARAALFSTAWRAAMTGIDNSAAWLLAASRGGDEGEREGGSV